MARQLLCCLIVGFALSVAKVSADACKTVVSPFAPCGGLASGCKGDQCVDGVWEGHCCSPGQVCVRKTQWYRKCEDIPLNCKPYDGPACAKVVPTYGACGGLGSDCVGCQCKDGPWDGYCCEKGAVCNKKTQFYYKCEPGPDTPVVAAPASLDPQPAANAAPTPKADALPLKPVSEVPPSKTNALPTKMAVVPVKALPESPKPSPKPVVTPVKAVPESPKPAATPAKPAVLPVKPAATAVPANKTAAATTGAACVGTPVPLYAACGGKGTGCKAGECKDAPWAGKCCVGVCRRKTEWYWKCEEASPTQLLSGCAPWKGEPCGVRKLEEFAPCGGKGSNCTGCDCKDAPWDGQCCPTGFKCVRQTQWHWKCVK